MSDLSISKNGDASVGAPTNGSAAGAPANPPRSTYGVAGNSSDQRGPTLISLEGASYSAPGAVSKSAVSVVYESAASPPGWSAGVFGLALVVAAGWLAVCPAPRIAEWWTRLTAMLAAERSVPIGGDSIAAVLNHAYASEAGRWTLALMFALTGAKLLRARFVYSLVTAALFAGAAYTVDALLQGKAVTILSSLSAAEGFAWRFGVVVCLALAALSQSGRHGRTLNAGSLLGFALVALASLGTVKNWYQWDTLAGRFLPSALEFLTRWGEECTWAVVLILTAVGIAVNRTRTVHFLNALVLIALAYHCVKTGYAEWRTFPELSADAATPIAIEEISIRNVEPWQWMIALELSCLAAVLLHMALGIGVLNLAYALTLMTAGLALSNSVGTMSLVRAGNDALGRSAEASPLFNMGLPVNDPRASAQTELPDLNVSSEGAHRLDSSPTTQSLAGRGRSTLTTEQRAAQEALQVRLSQQGAVREIAPFVWILLTAVIAGVVAVTGLRVLIADPRHRSAVAMLLVFAFGVAVALLWSVWPRNPHQSWSAWLAAFKLSRYHAHTVWIVFLGAAAVAGAFALHPNSRLVTWLHASIALVLVGTMASMVAAAMLIQFGNFPQLPVWVYAVVAAAQSSLAWVLLMHLNFSARSPRHRIAFAR
ncbi:MAG: hypothetical protein HBSAPP02_08630 [Phycisphaerae bacterium]|nr:MAG: hypothetical protein HRU71_13400 [Planctomycetia bacterium]RIK71562.1 MAG: hypothetical protein DCC66_01095 [Planctomycetota bacterium]GJQ25831.1 MAG: hypothetical protein HBSAPP02_08630 [Phycisphaerae bacterium]